MAADVTARATKLVLNTELLLRIVKHFNQLLATQMTSLSAAQDSRNKESLEPHPETPTLRTSYLADA